MDKNSLIQEIINGRYNEQELTEIKDAITQAEYETKVTRKSYEQAMHDENKKHELELLNLKIDECDRKTKKTKKVFKVLLSCFMGLFSLSVGFFILAALFKLGDAVLIPGCCCLFGGLAGMFATSTIEGVELVRLSDEKYKLEYERADKVVEISNLVSPKINQDYNKIEPLEEQGISFKQTEDEYGL